jgi:DNA repair ATPase RecN
MRRMQDVVDPEFEQALEAWDTVRRKEEELNANYKEKKAQIDAAKRRIKETLLAKLNELGVEGVRTTKGTISRVKKVRPVVTDWSAFWEYVIKTRNPGLLQKRVAARAVMEEMEETETLLPGIRVDSEYDIQIRRK